MPKTITICLKKEDSDDLKQNKEYRKLKESKELLEELNQKLSIENSKSLDEIERLEAILQSNAVLITTLQNKILTFNHYTDIDKYDQETQCSIPSIKIPKLELKTQSHESVSSIKHSNDIDNYSDDIISELRKHNQELRNDITKYEQREEKNKQKYRSLKKQMNVDYIKLKMLLSVNKNSLVDVFETVMGILDKCKTPCRIPEISKCFSARECEISTARSTSNDLLVNRLRGMSDVPFKPKVVPVDFKFKYSTPFKILDLHKHKS